MPIDKLFKLPKMIMLNSQSSMAGTVWQQNIDTGATLNTAPEITREETRRHTAKTPKLLVCPSYIT